MLLCTYSHCSYSTTAVFDFYTKVTYKYVTEGGLLQVYMDYRKVSDKYVYIKMIEINFATFDIVNNKIQFKTVKKYNDTKEFYLW